MRRRPRKAVDQAYFAELSIPEPNSGCWLWLGTLANKGYGTVALGGGKKTSAHRASYLVHTGHDVPQGYDVDHLCRNPACVNPDHLEAVTHLENCRRRSSAVEVCKYGHQLDGVKYRTGSASHRYCKTCERNSKLRTRERKRNERRQDY